jgi:hypothetical protein
VRRGAAILAWVAAFGIVQQASAAVPEGIPTAEPRAGPALAGPRVVWPAELDRYGFRLLTAPTGGTATQLLSIPAGPGGIVIPSLAASPQRTVLSYATGTRGGRSGSPFEGRTILTLSADGRRETLDESCSIGSVPDLPRIVDVSADAVVFPRCGSSGRQGAFVRDYSGPAPVDQPVPGARTAGLRIAGRYVAWLDRTQGAPFTRPDIVVHDRLTGTEAYRVPQAPLGELPSFDLQADGKVAYASSGPGGWRVAWASPSEPRPHVLPLAGREQYEVRIAGDRIGFMSGVQPCCGSVTLGEVGVSDLSGRARRVGDLAEGSLFTDDFDFDGERVAWWSYRCTDTVIRIASADGPDGSTGPRSGCPLRFERSPRVKSGWVRIYPDCFGFGAGFCEARDVVLTTRRGGERVVVGRGPIGSRVDLTRAGRTLLRGGRRVKARASAALVDDGGRRERRAGRLVLRRGR